MIIKVKTSSWDRPRAMGEDDFWRIFADVSSLVYGKQRRPDPRKFAPASDQLDDVTYHFYVSSEPAGDEIDGMFLSFYEDGNPVELFTNHECYLMNDNGRTIEQLHR